MSENKDLRSLYLGQIEDHCNYLFREDSLPAGIALALDELIKVDPNNFNVKSESISDLSTTYSGEGGIPVYILEWLAPYRGLHVAGNKQRSYWGE